MCAEPVVTVARCLRVTSVGLLYLWSADSIRKGTSKGLEGALGMSDIWFISQLPWANSDLGASALLLLSSLPRAAKGPVPAVLTVTSAAATYYYGKTAFDLQSLNTRAHPSL